jgi:hypothetical protein
MAVRDGCQWHSSHQDRKGNGERSPSGPPDSPDGGAPAMCTRTAQAYDGVLARLGDPRHEAHSSAGPGIRHV